MPGRGGHAAKCLGPPHDPITFWSRGKMPGTSPWPYYLLVTRQNAWDLLVTRENAWILPMNLLAIGHAGKCLGPPQDPITYWSRGKMPGTYWSRGKMPGTSQWPYYLLVTRQNALERGSRGKMPGTSPWPYYLVVTRKNAWDLPLTLIHICHAAKCLGPPHDPIAHLTCGKMPRTSPWPYYPLVTQENAWEFRDGY